MLEQVVRVGTEGRWSANSVEGSLLVALFGISLILGLAVNTYLGKFGQRRLRLVRTQVGLFACMALAVACATGISMTTGLSALWLPISLAPLWTAMGFDRRAGFVVTVAMALVLASFVGFDPVVLCVLLARGMAATLLFLDRRRTRQMIYAGLCAGMSSALVLLAVSVIAGQPADVLGDLARPADSTILACVGGGLVEGLLAAILRAPAERILGHVSRERLLELTDLEQPLLRRLAEEAPGSYEHSRAMANLAEQAASAIGANALLTRVGAYYHDLGKTVCPKHFVENQEPGEKSPHDDLAPEESARRIVQHVVEGTHVLREGGIPEPVVEFAYTHHGTQLIEYFYKKYRDQGDGSLGEEHFRYPGMRPQTKETAILMLVDSIEAASRTIDPPDRERFDQMVQRIIFTKLSQGQLDDSGLSMRELRIIQRRMVDTLVHMHHHRIKYPWQTERAEQFGVPSGAMRDQRGTQPQDPTGRLVSSWSFGDDQEPSVELSESPAVDERRVVPIDRPAPGAVSHRFDGGKVVGALGGLAGRRRES